MLPFIQLRLQLFAPGVEAAGGHPVLRKWDEQTEVVVTFPVVIVLFYITFVLGYLVYI